MSYTAPARGNMMHMTQVLRSRGWAVAVVVTTLVLVNVIDNTVAHASLVLGPAGAVWLLLVARRAGLSWRDLGLGPGTWRRGFAWAGALIGAVAVVYAAGAALPLTRNAFRDTRYHLDLGHSLLTAFVLIPVGTVLFEEVAFRGVLWGLVRKGRGALIATVVSSVLFGLWHVLPSLGLAGDNQAVGDAVGKGTAGQVLSVLGTVLFTGLSGVVFCELRRRSGSLLASAGLHWATNGLGVLASAAVWGWATR
jgi:membrane protease YdiL (CAAX protease family)